MCKCLPCVTTLSRKRAAALDTALQIVGDSPAPTLMQANSVHLSVPRVQDLQTTCLEGGRYVTQSCLYEWIVAAHIHTLSVAAKRSKRCTDAARRADAASLQTGPLQSPAHLAEARPTALEGTGYSTAAVFQREAAQKEKVCALHPPRTLPLPLNFRVVQ